MVRVHGMVDGGRGRERESNAHVASCCLQVQSPCQCGSLCVASECRSVLSNHRVPSPAWVVHRDSRQLPAGHHLKHDAAVPVNVRRPERARAGVDGGPPARPKQHLHGVPCRVRGDAPLLQVRVHARQLRGCQEHRLLGRCALLCGLVRAKRAPMAPALVVLGSARGAVLHGRHSLVVHFLRLCRGDKGGLVASRFSAAVV
mmetsp:Transcript_21142/g.53252  ORF Transcript_21142/g.53252 Transcript_21142/m.53252 type:complete len:201 (-) Transcript_21142:108-710(-)